MNHLYPLGCDHLPSSREPYKILPVLYFLIPTPGLMISEAPDQVGILYQKARIVPNTIRAFHPYPEYGEGNLFVSIDS